MTELGEILGWKHNHCPGIRTDEGILTEWPVALGPWPSDEQIVTWTAEYETAQATAADTLAARRVRIAELNTIPRDAWTLAQMRELLALVARETL